MTRFQRQGLVLNSTSLQWTSVQVGTSSTQNVTISNPTYSRVTITGASISSPDFQISAPSLPVTLTPGQSVQLSIRYAPGAAGTSSATVTIFSSSNITPTLQMSIRATATAPPAPAPTSASGPGQLTVQPASLSFGNVAVGTKQTATGSVTNSGGSSLTITQASASPSTFSLSSLTLPLTLAPGQSASFTATFTPTQGGNQSGSITITANGSTTTTTSFFRYRARNTSSTPQTITIAVAGTGTTAGQLAVNTTNLSFGSVTTGQSQTMAETISNSGGAAITVNQVTVTGSGFGMSGMSLPMSLAPGQSANFNVAFAPKSAGAASGTLAISSTASNAVANVSLSGTAVTAGSLSLGSSSLAFGSAQIGSSQTLSETVTNSGGTQIVISQATASGTGFSMTGPSLPVTLAAGQSTSFTVKFAPVAAGTDSGSLIISSNGSNPSLSVPFSGTATGPGELTPSPSSLSFGNVQTSNSGSQSETLKNTGQANVTISKAAFSSSAFSVSGLNLPLTLIPGQSFTFGVQFAPQATGAANGSMVLTSNADVANLTIVLSGNGTSVGQLAMNPSSLSFGSVTVGTTEQLNLKLSASGSSVTVSALVPSTSEFSITGPSLPVVVPAGQSASFTVTFSPQASGSASATLSVSSDASSSPAIALVGTGAAAPQHSVALSWAPDQSTVAGYNVYRTTISGQNYSKLNSGLTPTTNYTDTPVQSGQTYYYVTTAVDSSGKESSYSNQVQVSVPTP